MKNVIFYISLLFLANCAYNKEEDLIANCSESVMTIGAITTDADCDLSNGSATINVKGGVPSYKYDLNGVMQDKNKFTGLAAGNYLIKVTDNRECTARAEFIVESNNGVSAEATATNSGCGTSIAGITVSAKNGATPYTYALDGGTPQQSNIFTNLPAGEHTIEVTDKNDCKFTITQTIQTGISYTATVESIISNNCAVSGCHNGSQYPDFRMLANIQANKVSIRTRTQNKTMPAGGGSLTQKEIDAIACWIDDGALDN